MIIILSCLKLIYFFDCNNLSISFLFFSDIGLNFRTSFVNKNGQVCYDSRLIALNYMKGWFLLDLLAAIPFELLYLLAIETVSYNSILFRKKY